MSRQHFLICYDIREPQRLQRVHRCIKGDAMQVQYSVYYAHCLQTELQQLLVRLSEIIELEDDIRIYRVPARQSVFTLQKGTQLAAIHDKTIVIQD